MSVPSKTRPLTSSEGGFPNSADESGVDPLLTALGFPDADPEQPALTALHAGASFHRLAVITDVIEAYAREARLPSDEPAYLDLLRRPLRGEPPRATAERLYRAALRVDERLAEAWFNLGRLLQDGGKQGEALHAFERAASLPPHPRAQPHAHLHANAHWHAATILEDTGCDTKALARYREAIARCDNFGVHHVRFAHFLRRHGMLAEATAHYEKLMIYSHLYFTEFILPPLRPVPPSAQLGVFEVLYRTSDGAVVLFYENEYHRISSATLPAIGKMLVALGDAAAAALGQSGAASGFRTRLSRLAMSLVATGSTRGEQGRAKSISDLEPGPPPAAPVA